jgi:hypothetical protein
MIECHGRTGWQLRSDYRGWSLFEAVIFRYETIIERRLHARTPSNQKTETKIGCAVLNRLTDLGMPVPVRVK